jgi:hypothetical protein
MKKVTLEDVGAESAEEMRQRQKVRVRMHEGGRPTDRTNTSKAVVYRAVSDLIRVEQAPPLPLSYTNRRGDMVFIKPGDILEHMSALVASERALDLRDEYFGALKMRPGVLPIEIPWGQLMQFRLHELDLGECGLKTLPDFDKKSTIRVLWLHRNQLTRLPTLPSLDSLCLNFNSLPSGYNRHVVRNVYSFTVDLRERVIGVDRAQAAVVCVLCIGSFCRLMSFPRDIACMVAKLIWQTREEPVWSPSKWELAMMGPLSIEAFAENAEAARKALSDLEKNDTHLAFAKFVSYASGEALQWTGLGYALYQGNVELSKILLDQSYAGPLNRYALEIPTGKQIFLEQIFAAQVFPLGLAIAHCPALAPLLLKKGAKQTPFVYLDGTTYTPIEFALHCNRPELAELLKQRLPIGKKIASKLRQLSPRREK